MTTLTLISSSASTAGLGFSVLDGMSTPDCARATIEDKTSKVASEAARMTAVLMLNLVWLIRHLAFWFNAFASSLSFLTSLIAAFF